jgi:hypothetical protein
MKKLFTTICVLSVSSLIILSCKKNTTTATPAASSSTGGTTGATSVNSTPQVTYSMGGTNYSYVVNNSTYFSGSSVSKSLNASPTPSTVIFSADINDNNTISYLNINKGKMSFTGASSPDSTTFKAYFPVGTVAYSANALNGIEITSYDGTTLWSTSTGSQTGSTFNIVATKPTWGGGYLYMKFYATFSCKLYDPSGLNPKTITNGVFVGEFGNI